MTTTPRFLNAGDAALIVEFGDAIEPRLLGLVTDLDRQIRQRIETGELAGIIETVPTFRSLAVLIDPCVTSPDEIQLAVEGLVDRLHPEQRSARRWTLPVQYGGEAGLDLDELSRTLCMDAEQIIRRHQEHRVRVYMLGFLPGFAFLGDIAEVIRVPRRSEPRTRVPAGSVAIANQLTAIYPSESPGGWHVIGRCPVPLFHVEAEPPALLRAGDEIAFRIVDEAEFETLADDYRLGRASPDDCLDDSPET